MKNVFLSGIALLGLVALPALSQGVPRATDKVYGCAEIANDQERLTCFDQAIAELRAAEDAGTVRTVDNVEIQKIERETFGFSLPNLRFALRGLSSNEETNAEARKFANETDEISEVTEEIAHISKHAVTKRVTITLKNGQVWEQIDSRQVQANRIRNPKEANIRRAALRSYMMSIDGSAAIRVKRIS